MSEAMQPQEHDEVMENVSALLNGEVSDSEFDDRVGTLGAQLVMNEVERSIRNSEI